MKSRAAGIAVLVLAYASADAYAAFHLSGTWARPFRDPVTGVESWVGASKPIAPTDLRVTIAKAAHIDVADLAAPDVQPCAAGTAMLFRQLFKGRSIANAGVFVHRKGDVVTYARSAVVKPPVTSTPPPRADDPLAFVRAAIRGYFSDADSVHVQRVSAPSLFAFRGRARWSVEARVAATERGKDHFVRISDVIVAIPDGHVLAVYDRTHGLNDPEANVFDPTPLRQCTSDEYDRIIRRIDADDMYAKQPLTDLDTNSTTASGTYAEFVDLDGVPNGIWTCMRNGKCDFHLSWYSDPQAFAEVNAYFVITTMQHYVQDLGFTNLANRRIRIDSMAEVGDERAAYINLPVGNGDLRFGFDSGLNTADDGKVVAHEYGHALLASAVPRYSDRRGEPAALSEGFADYIALSAFAATETDACRTCIAGFMNGGNCLRDLKRDNVNLKYDRRKPKNNPTDAYDLGSIWTRALWSALEALAPSMGWNEARKVTDRAALLGNCYIGQESGDLTLPLAAVATLSAIRDNPITKTKFDVFCNSFVAVNLIDAAGCRELFDPHHVVN